MPHVTRSDTEHWFLKVLLLQALLCVLTPCLAADATFTIRDGEITYRSEDGMTKPIHTTKKCADLWVAPSGSIIAFITIDRAKIPNKELFGYPETPLPEKTSIYIAQKSNGFLPKLLTSNSVTINGRWWAVLRKPSLSPNQRILYFSVPYTMTTSKLIGFHLGSDQYKLLGDTTDYCTIWYGQYSGDQLFQKRYLPEDPAKGVAYVCYLRSETGTPTKVGEPCDDFERFTSTWTAKHGGICSFWTPQN